LCKSGFIKLIYYDAFIWIIQSQFSCCTQSVTTKRKTNKQQNVPTALSNYSNSIPTAYFLLFVRFILFKANDNFPFEYKITQSLKWSEHYLKTGGNCINEYWLTNRLNCFKFLLDFVSNRNLANCWDNILLFGKLRCCVWISVIPLGHVTFP
jgi:hypothetical protein